MKIQFRYSIISIILIMLLISCSKNQETTRSTSNHINDDKVYKYIRSLGYPEASIDENDSAYIVEGDMVFSKRMVVPKDTGRVGIEEQYYNNGGLVNLAHQIIGIRIDPSMAAQTAEVNAAVNLWNNAHSWITFQVVNSGEQIIIRNANLGVGVCGQGDFPSNGLPGPTININLNQVVNDGFNQRMINIAHEMGHTIGFRHTNGDNGTFGLSVSGYGGTDASSIMNGGMCHSLPTQLSTKDIGAVNSLYPNPYPKNVKIDINSYQFTVKWDYLPDPLNDNILGIDVEYSGQSGIGFSGTAHLTPSATSFVIPGVSPYPTSGNNTQMGYVGATVKVLYTNNIIYSASSSRSKANGVWQ